MKTAREWIESDSGHFDPECEACASIIREIQVDALESAAVVSENAHIKFYDVDELKEGIAEEIRKLKPTEPR